MKRKIILVMDNEENIRLRSIEERDIEELRLWKNRNASSFFYQKEISHEEQEIWFYQYLLRPNDYIFMAEIQGDGEWYKFGCMGYRESGDEIDLYNIIRGNETKMRSSMKTAMSILLNHLLEVYTKPIKCDVLVDNPAVKWYNRCGFYIREIEEDYCIMQFSRDDRRSI